MALHSAESASLIQPGRQKKRKILLLFSVGAAALLGLLFALSQIFLVRAVTVAGNTRSTAAQATGALQNVGFPVNLLTLDKRRVADALRLQMPYANTVVIHRKWPSGLRLTITDGDAAFLAQAQDRWWLLRADGRLLESVTAAECATAKKNGVVPLVNVVLMNPQAGQAAVFKDGTPQTQSLLMLAQALRETALTPRVTELRFSDGAPQLLIDEHWLLALAAPDALTPEALPRSLALAEISLAEIRAENPHIFGILNLQIPGRAIFHETWTAP
jgi:cell division septal protein FtsQ